MYHWFSHRKEALTFISAHNEKTEEAQARLVAWPHAINKDRAKEWGVFVPKSLN